MYMALCTTVIVLFSVDRFSPLERAFHREQVSPAPSARSTARSSSTGAPWRRSVSRDLATDIERVFSDAAPSATATLPRGNTLHHMLFHNDCSTQCSPRQLLLVFHCVVVFCRPVHAVSNQIVTYMTMCSVQLTTVSFQTACMFIIGFFLLVFSFLFCFVSYMCKYATCMLVVFWFLGFFTSCAILLTNVYQL